MAVVEMLVAPPGSGKSFSLVKYIVDEWLPFNDGPVWSNLPLKIDEICEYLIKKGRDPEKLKVRERLKSIPKEVIHSWIDDTEHKCSGPWEFFQGDMLTGAFVVIDECHNFCTSKSHKQHKKAWSDWLGEIRHREATIRFISQNEMKIATSIRQHCAKKRELVSGDVRRDPWFGIEMSDWYELKAKFSGQWSPVVFELEMAEINGRWKETNRKQFTLGEPYYSLYNSWSQPEGEKGATSQAVAGGRKTRQKFEVFSWPRLIWWFVSRNFFALGSRFVIVGLFIFVVTNPASVIQSISGFFGNFAPGAVSQANDPDQVDGTKEAEETAATTDEGPEPETDPLEAALAEVKETQEKLNTLIEQEEAHGHLVAITPARAVFSSGATYLQGSKITEGFYAGHSITKIDMQAGYIQLSDKNRTKIWLHKKSRGSSSL